MTRRNPCRPSGSDADGKNGIRVGPSTGTWAVGQGNDASVGQRTVTVKDCEARSSRRSAAVRVTAVTPRATPWIVSTPCGSTATVATAASADSTL